MSYRPDDQALEEPLGQIINGIKLFGERVQGRVEVHTEWSDDHINDIVGLRAELQILEIRLRRLEEETW